MFVSSKAGTSFTTPNEGRDASRRVMRLGPEDGVGWFERGVAAGCSLVAFVMESWREREGSSWYADSWSRRPLDEEMTLLRTGTSVPSGFGFETRFDGLC